MTGPILGTLDLSHVETLVEWADAEGWNPGLADATMFHAADPLGFIGCFSEGVLVAGISAVRYGTDFGFIGLYITHPNFRGKGYGRIVWDAAMAHLACRTIGLDGVPAQQANYRSMGFQPRYDTVRWSGRVKGEVCSEVMPVNDMLLPDIIDFDGRYFPAPREEFLRRWLEPPHSARVLIHDGIVHGLAVVRPCQQGSKVGPLFAASATDAVKLLKACAADDPQAPLHIDVPTQQALFCGLLRAMSMTSGFQTTRMYRGLAPSGALTGVYGVTTLELG